MEKESTDAITARRNAALDRYVVPEIEMLMRVARSMTRNSTDAEDLVQETLLRAYRAIDRFDGKYPRSWLLTIMRNAWINETRRKVPELLSDPDTALGRLEQTNPEMTSPESVVVDSSLDADVAAAFKGLPEKFSRVVELVDLDGLSYQETADTLGIAIGTVMSRLHRARKRMKEHLTASGKLGGAA